MQQVNHCGNRRIRGNLPTILILLAVSLFSLPTWAQTAVSELTEEELIDNYHREAYREEFRRRMVGYTAEEREAAAERLHDKSRRRSFPEGYTDDELLDLVRSPGEKNAYNQARNELKRRYAEATPDEVSTLVGHLHEIFKDTPYPVFNQDGYNTNSEIYHALSYTAKECLPEEAALALFQEVYLESGQKGAITLFLLQLDGKSFKRTATRTVLEELAKKVSNWDESKLTEMGEHESLRGMIHNKIRQCSDNSFAAIKARNWTKSDLDIYAMGNSDSPEARALLLEYYETISKEYWHCEKRLRTLSALTNHWKRNPDVELRDLLRNELSEILNMDHNENPYMIEKSAEAIAKTNDPWFLPLLRKRLATLDLNAIKAALPLPEPSYADRTIKSVKSYLTESITTLEKAQADS